MKNLGCRSPQKGAAAGVSPDDRFVSMTIEDCHEPAESARFSTARDQSFLQVFAGALESGGTGLWSGVTTVARVRLTVPERAAATFAMLRSLPPDQREATVEAAFFDAGRPPPLILDDQEIMAEARLRAVASTTRAVKAAMAAGWEVLDEGDRDGFLSRVVGREGLLRHVRQVDADTLDALGLTVASAMRPARWRQLVDHMKKGARHDAKLHRHRG